MSYENPIPKIPSRAEEIDIINKTKESIKDTNYKQLLLNESNRIQQQIYREKVNNYNWIWWRNFVRGAAVFAVPCLLMAVSFRKTKYGVPRYRVSKFYDAFQLPHIQSPRLILVLKFVTPTWILGSYLYAHYMTSPDDLFDEYYDKYDKTVLPYQLY